MIRHDHPRVHVVMSQPGAILERIKNQLCNGRLPEEGRATASLIEHPVQADEGLAGGEIRGRKGTIYGKAAMQAERDKQGLADDMQVREAAPFERHAWIV